jgi:hypothetical protein
LPVISSIVTAVRFWNEGRDLAAEYWNIKERRPAAAEAIRDAVTVIWSDPETAQKRYSISLDSEAGYLAMPFLSPDGMTCLVWRHSPDGDDAIEIVDFGQPWGDDLDLPLEWPRS